MNHGIYVHIPFCRKKCGYCSFFSISDPVFIENYTDRLILDIRDTLPATEKIKADTVYFGGGTPSLLSPESVEKIIECISDNSILSEKAEITLEMNPEDAVESKIRGFAGAGINRIVLGIQTVNQEFHDAIGRSGLLCNREILDRFFSIEGFDHCIDLIMGIPGQTPKNIEDDLSFILKYKPGHISAYILSIDKGTLLYNRINRDEKFEKMQVDVFRKTIEILKNAGYEHYEISNFSLNGNRSRHNMKYWKYEPYLGFGPSAHSFYNSVRYSNNMNVIDYINSEKPENSVDERNGNSVIAEIFLTGLRLAEGISLAEAELQGGIPVPEQIKSRLESLQKTGKIFINAEDKITINPDYFFFADTVIYELVQDII